MSVRTPTSTSNNRSTSTCRKRGSDIPTRPDYYCRCSICIRRSQVATTARSSVTIYSEVEEPVDGNTSLHCHDPQVQDATRLRKEVIARTKQQRLEMTEAEDARKPQMFEPHVVRPAHLARGGKQVQQEARMVEVTKEEVAKTFQHVVLDFVVVTFGAGFVIQHILTGFESCRVRVKDLPLGVGYNEVHELFTLQGIERSQFHVVGMNKTSNGKQEAGVICREDLKNKAMKLDGVDFRGERLLLEVHQNGSAEGMKSSVAGHSNVLTISWRAPSVDFVATYLDWSEAERKTQELDRKICAGRRVKAEMSRPPAGHFHSNLFANAVTIRGLPLTVTDTVVAQFSGSTLLRRLEPTEYDIVQAPEYIRHEVERIARGRLELFQTVDTDAIEGIFTAQAHFDSWKQADKVYSSLQKQRFWFISETALLMDLPYPYHYKLAIPIQQYQNQKTGWDSVAESSKDKDGCIMWVEARDKVYIIHVAGEEKKAVGSLKVRVENLAAGENLEPWHRSLGAGADGQRFLVSVFNATGAYIRYDWRLRALKAYGEPRNVDKACSMIESEVERLESLEQTIFLKREAVEFFVRRGIETFVTGLGKDDVALDISSSPCKVTIRGGELARHTLNKVIDEAPEHSNPRKEVRHDPKCPICQDEVSSPVQLACGHTYCLGCLRHFLRTAPDTKIFPLCCMGDDNNCRIPISIPTLQRLLSPQQFQHLLEAAFVTHIERFPREFKHCPTPGCNQVYRCNRSSTSLVQHCPSCLLAMCSSCHNEAHKGMTCKEVKLHLDPAEQERLNDQLAKQSGFKKCPECKVWIEKNGGCNHVSCKCGADICWLCMRAFTRATIFKHMETPHNDFEAQYGAQMDLPRELREQQQDQFREEEQRQYRRERRQAQREEQRRNRRGRRSQAQREIQDDLYSGVRMERPWEPGLRLDQPRELLRGDESSRRWQVQPEIPEVFGPPDVFPPQVIRGQENHKGCVII